MRNLIQSLRGLVISAPLALLAMLATAERADAVQITVLGQLYNISVATLDTTVAGPLASQQPWFTGGPDASIALQAAIDVGDSALIPGSTGPVYFAHDEPFPGTFSAVSLSGLNPPKLTGITGGVFDFAVATAVPEINGSVLAQVLLILSAGYLLLRGRRQPGV